MQTEIVRMLPVPLANTENVAQCLRMVQRCILGFRPITAFALRLVCDSGSATAGAWILSEFWLSEVRFERLRSLLSDKVRGVARVDDRRVISGIIHVMKPGGRWIDAPACYGPRKTLYNRFVGGEGRVAGVARHPGRADHPPRFLSIALT